MRNTIVYSRESSVLCDNLGTTWRKDKCDVKLWLWS